MKHVRDTIPCVPLALAATLLTILAGSPRPAQAEGVAAAGRSTGPAEAAQAASKFVRVTLHASQDAVRPGDSLLLAVSFDFLQPDLHVYGPDSSSGIPTRVEPIAPANFTFGRPVYPPSKTVNDGGQAMTEFDRGFSIFIPVIVPAAPSNSAGPRADFSVRVTYQVCGQLACFESETASADLTLPLRPVTAAVKATDEALFSTYRLLARAPSSQSAQADVANATVRTPTSGQNKAPPASPETAAPEVLGAGASAQPTIWDFNLTNVHWAFALLLALLAGLALNLTPCVLPIIPLTIGFFVHQSQVSRQGGEAGTHRQGILLSGAAFALGMIGAFVVLGGLVVLARQQFQVIFEQPTAVLGLGLFMVVMAMGMFELYPVQLPNFVGRLAGGRSGLGGALVMGALAAVMSTPCTGPWLGSMIGFALKAPPVLGLASFAGLGLGMALPYLLLTAAPGLLDRVPRSGKWTGLVKSALGFILLGMALSVFNGLRSDPRRWQFAVWASIAVAATLWVCATIVRSRHSEAGWVWPARLALLIVVGFTLCRQWPAESALGVGSAADPAAGKPIAGQTHLLAGVQWYDYDPGLLGRARQANLPVLLDLVSDNCHYCDQMEEKVWSTEAAARSLKGFVAVRVNTSRSDGQPLMARYGVVGNPGLMFLDRQGQPVKDGKFSPVNFYDDPARFVEAVRPIRQSLGLPPDGR